MKLAEVGERAAVERILKLLGPPPKGIGPGDDCAAIPLDGQYLLVTTDVVNEGVHFPSEAPRDLVGWHCAAVNLSDIAAKGGDALGLTVAVSLPRSADDEDAYAIMKGATKCAKENGTVVWGGDTKEGSAVSAAGTAFGTVAKEKFVPRGGAKPGDLVAMTGKVGTAAVAWQRWVDSRDQRELRRLLMVKPRLAEGKILGSRGATAMTDMSDGLATACRLIGAASNCVIQLDWEQLPLAAGYAELFAEGAPETMALGFGGEYELCFTVPDDDDMLLKLERSLAKTRSGVTIVGSVERAGKRIAGKARDAGEVFLRHGDRLLPVTKLGWEQFKSKG